MNDASHSPADAGDAPATATAPLDAGRRRLLLGAAAAAGTAAAGCDTAPLAEPAAAPDPALAAKVRKVVVIYAENRSFNNLFADFPGLQQPLAALPPERTMQRDRDGALLAQLPPVWGGLVPQAQQLGNRRYAIAEKQITGLPNRPFRVADAQGEPLPLTVVTRDLVHRFYQNQAQINGGRCDSFVAWGNSGALVMGNYSGGHGGGHGGSHGGPVRADASPLRLWQLAREFTLCDNFFMSAFGGSYMNHVFLIAGEPHHHPDVHNAPAKSRVAQLDGDDPAGTRLKLHAQSPASALDGPPRYAHDGAYTPDGWGINTLSAPYQPSYAAPAAGGDRTLADPANSAVVPPQTGATIGSRLSDKGVSWAWYAGGWQHALDQGHPIADDQGPNFQSHHQPFNYMAAYAPGTAARAEHLRDGGTGDDASTNRFIADIEADRLPAVSFYKPQGTLNMHAGYADIASGDAHIGHIVDCLRRSPSWHEMVVVITVDENGGWWDHVAPPVGDRWGPGTRIPALVVSPHAKRGHVDHTVYDTNSILRFLTRLHGLQPLPGVQRRDAAMRARGQPLLGDLRNALDLG